MGTGYRPPSKEPKGRWARHIHAVRRERGWSAQRGFEAVHEGLGLSPKSRAAYLPFESGERTPTPTEEAALAAVYGWPPESPTEALEATESGDTGMAALIAAIRDQTAAMVDLVNELQAARGLSPEVRERVAALEAYAAEHERRLRADRQLMGLAPLEEQPSQSEFPVASRS